MLVNICTHQYFKRLVNDKWNVSYYFMCDVKSQTLVLYSTRILEKAIKPVILNTIDNIIFMFFTPKIYFEK